MYKLFILIKLIISLLLIINLISCSIPTNIVTSPFTQEHFIKFNGTKNFDRDLNMCVMNNNRINGLQFDNFEIYTRDPYGKSVTKYICYPPFFHDQKDAAPIFGPFKNYLGKIHYQSELSRFYKNNHIIGEIKKGTKYHYVKIVSTNFVAFVIQIDSGLYQHFFAILHAAPQSL